MVGTVTSSGLPQLSTSVRAKIVTADEAMSLVPDNVTVACGGFVGAAHPEALTAALERRFLATGSPRGLTLVYAAGQGDSANRGLNHLAHAGLIKRVIGGHWGLVPKLGQLALSGAIEAYNFPQGVVCHLFRESAAKRPGLITSIGLGTFIDPEFGGGRLNDSSPEPLVERIEVRGRTWLFFHSWPIHVGLIRATAADPFGNLVMDDEAIIGDVLPIAQAARNHGGIVVAQVKKFLEHPASPKQVRVPGIYVDHIVLAEGNEHAQTFGEWMNDAYCSTALHGQAATAMDSLPFDARRIIASRACDELRPGWIVNLGIGMPEGIARIAAERQLLQQVTLTVESGPIGGMPVGGLSFGAAIHPQAVIDQPSQFDFYDGGGLDFAALGAAQIDTHGNVNVSRFGKRLAGVGGFVNISQSARRLVFCGTLTSGGLQVAFENGKLRIAQEGLVRKCVQSVEQVSFSGDFARSENREVLYVTERAVFRLAADGVELIEVAPGIQIERDILSQMDFQPVIRNVKTMRCDDWKPKWCGSPESH
jgi:propionate CoA-transferase